MDIQYRSGVVGNSRWRGWQICYDEHEELWYYEDTGQAVKDNPQRTCGFCQMEQTNDHDPCIANLPGVQNACCGHGDRESSYIQFEDGRIVRGFWNESA